MTPGGKKRSPLESLRTLFAPRKVEAQAVPAALVTAQEPEHPSVKESVPWSLQVAAAWAWRLILIGIVAVGLGFAIHWMQIVVIPALIALLLAVLLEPVLRLQMKYLRLPRTLAAAIALIFGLVVVFGLVGLASNQIIKNIPLLVKQARGGIDATIEWVVQLGPSQLDDTAVRQAWAEVQTEISHWLESNSSTVASGALDAASSATTVLGGTLMCLFCTFFFLKDGRKMWQWVLRLLPAASRSPLNEAAIRGWVTLGSYVRTQMLVAAIDAVGIGLGAYFLSVSLAVPIAVLVFFASFIPIVGAISTGILAVAIAMVTQGPGTAVAMIIVILAVQQIESNVLHPFLMSSAVSLHPVAVLLAVAAGGYLAGIVGAVFAVPLLAFFNTTVLYLAGYDMFLKLRYDPDRPGGAPGALEKELAESARPNAQNVEDALKAREEARANGTLEELEATLVSAGKTQKEIQDTLAEFDDVDQAAPIPSTAKPLPEHLDTAEQGARQAEPAPTRPEDVED